MGVTELPDRHKGDGLTVRQRRVLEVIRNSVDRRGYPPSMREIGDAVGLASPSSVSHQLNALVAKGYLRRDPNRPRAIEIVSPELRVGLLSRDLGHVNEVCRTSATDAQQNSAGVRNPAQRHTAALVCQTRRKTAVTLPRRVAWSPSMGEKSGLCGSSHT